MGQRGPKPMPTAMAKRRGYKPRKGRLPSGQEPKADDGAPDIPVALRGDTRAIKCWNRMRPMLLRMKVLTKADGLALEGLCRAYSMAQQADEAVEQYGMITVDRISNVPKSNPAVAMSRQAWAEVRKFSQEFGLTPSSRSRVREASEPDSGKRSTEQSAEDFLFGDQRVANGDENVIPFRRR